GMTPREQRLSIVEGWKRKICEFAIQSDDTLAPVISKGFDAVSTILKGSRLDVIHRALESLDLELDLYKRSENSKELSIRSMMVGFMFTWVFFMLKKRKVSQ
ncbi:hypothetical protein PENTCL1PPCAC_25196, partial [Pristionchus entomophagus]